MIKATFCTKAQSLVLFFFSFWSNGFEKKEPEYHKKLTIVQISLIETVKIYSLALVLFVDEETIKSFMVCSTAC